MSKYTTEVRWICEMAANRGDHKIDLEEATPTEIITAAAPYIFNFDFPMYDEKYRLPLEVKILRHYYGREIGAETVGRWKLQLEDRLNIIMPYYNELYKTTLYEFNPLYDVDYTKSGHRNGTQDKDNTTTENVSGSNSKERAENKNTQAERSDVENGTGTKSTETEGNSTRTDANTTDSTGTSHNVNLYSDTPQGSLEIFGIETPPTPTVVGNSWLTNATIDDGNTTAHTQSSGESGIQNEETVGETYQNAAFKTGHTDIDETTGETESGEHESSRVQNETGNITNFDEYVETVRGKMSAVSYARLIREFRENLLNIDKMIINELDDLFFGLWG